MYQAASNDITTLSRSAGPVWITRLAMRPAKSFWKNVQLCRTTCQWFCQRIRFDRPGFTIWLISTTWQSSTDGRSTSSTTAMPASCGQASCSRVGRGVAGDQADDPADEGGDGHVEDAGEAAEQEQPDDEPALLAQVVAVERGMPVHRRRLGLPGGRVEQGFGAAEHGFRPWARQAGGAPTLSWCRVRRGHAGRDG